MNLLGFIEQWKLIRCGFGSMLIFDSVSEGESGSSPFVGGGSLGPVQPAVGGSPASKPVAGISPRSKPVNTINPYRIPTRSLQQAMGAPRRILKSMGSVPNRATAQILSRVPLSVIYPIVNTATNTGKRLLLLFSFELLSKIRNLI